MQVPGTRCAFRIGKVIPFLRGDVIVFETPTPSPIYSSEPMTPIVLATTFWLSIPVSPVPKLHAPILKMIPVASSVPTFERLPVRSPMAFPPRVVSLRNNVAAASIEPSQRITAVWAASNPGTLPKVGFEITSIELSYEQRMSPREILHLEAVLLPGEIRVRSWAKPGDFSTAYRIK